MMSAVAAALTARRRLAMDIKTPLETGRPPGFRPNPDRRNQTLGRCEGSTARGLIGHPIPDGTPEAEGQDEKKEAPRISARDQGANEGHRADANQNRDEAPSNWPQPFLSLQDGLRAGDVARLESMRDPKPVVPIEGENSLQPRGVEASFLPLSALRVLDRASIRAEQRRPRASHPGAREMAAANSTGLHLGSDWHLRGGPRWRPGRGRKSLGLPFSRLGLPPRACRLESDVRLGLGQWNLRTGQAFGSFGRGLA